VSDDEHGAGIHAIIYYLFALRLLFYDAAAATALPTLLRCLLPNTLQANRIINHENAILHFDLYTHIDCECALAALNSLFHQTAYW
jgi:hypothetical protein